MRRVALSAFLTVFIVGTISASLPASGGAQGTSYPVVKVCSLLSLAEVKKFEGAKPTVVAHAKAFAAKLR